jgi:hypothetical protein
MGCDGVLSGYLVRTFRGSFVDCPEYGGSKLPRNLGNKLLVNTAPHPSTM